MASGLSLKSHGPDLNITLTLYFVPGVSTIILNGDAAAAHVDWSPGGIIDHRNVVDVVTQPVLGVSMELVVFTSTVSRLDEGAPALTWVLGKMLGLMTQDAAQGHRGQGGGVTEHLCTPGVGHVI